MVERVGIVGLDLPEAEAIRERLGVPVVACETLPRAVVQDGLFRVESPSSGRMLPVSRLVFHGIFEDDLDFLTAAAFWGGPCLPSASALMDCRLRFPCLVRALRHTRFPMPGRGYAGPGAPFVAEGESVAKWGNWHCGDNKERFRGLRVGNEAAIVEPFLAGEAVRIVVIGDRAWQVRLEGPGWLKSIHDPVARLVEVDPGLLADARAVGAGLGLEILANDYLVDEAGTPHLLEVNHVPNVTRFPEVWEAYRDHVVAWASGN